MPLPPLLQLQTEREYREYFINEYCRSIVKTFDGIRVYFNQNNFRHAFYESSQHDGRKDQFSWVRAHRMDWIKSTLENPNAELYQGWNKKNSTYEPNRRVCVVYENFVVVIQLALKNHGQLKGKFTTCYQADNSIEKIRRSPLWSLAKCLQEV